MKTSPRLVAALAGSALALGAPPLATAATLVIPMNVVSADGVGASIGGITAVDSPSGLMLTPELSGLAPGEHGFHVHDRPSCAPGPDPDKGGTTSAAFGAGGHLDPSKSGKHEGPEGTGHLGDLPFLAVGSDGRATKPVIAPHLGTADLKGHALMIHIGGDNYSDQPTKLGGGGGRIACGVVS